MVPATGIFALHLRNMRQEAGLSQSRLGEMIGQGQRAISAWETTFVHPSYANIRKMHRAINPRLPAHMQFPVEEWLQLRKECRANQEVQMAHLRASRNERVQRLLQTQRRHELRLCAGIDTIVKIESLVSSQYPSASRVVEELILSALSSRAIMKKFEKRVLSTEVDDGEE